jgi:hypothetical protein
VADAFATADGVKVTLSWQLVPAASAVPQLFTWLNWLLFDPVMEILLILTATVPSLVRSAG